MSQITDLKLSLISKILVHRLTRPATTGTTILNPSEATSINVINIDGRFIGYFKKRPNNEPCFVLLGRSDPQMSIDFFCVFYLRTNYKHIQPSEKLLYKKLLPGIFEEPQTVMCSVINIHTKASKSCDLSILLQTVEFTVHPSLIEQYTSSQVINVNRGSSLVCFNANVDSPDCSCKLNLSDDKLLHQAVQVLNLKIVKYDYDRLPDRISRDFHVLAVRYKSHIVYLVHYESVKVIMILLPHPNQFTCDTDAESFTNNIKKRLNPYKPNYFGAKRFYGITDVHCDDRNILKACLLCIIAKFPLTIVRQTDIDCMLSDSMLELTIQAYNVPDTSNVPDLQAETLDDDDTEEYYSSQATITYYKDDDDIQAMTDVRFDGEDGDTEVLSIWNQFTSSQATVIVPEEILKLELSTLKVLPTMNEMLEALYPPVPNIGPRNDFDNSILHDFDFYHEALTVIGTLFYTSTSVFIHDIVDFATLSNRSFKIDLRAGRLIIIPFKDNKFNMLAVIDANTREWAYLEPENECRCKDDSCPYDSLYKLVWDMLNDYCPFLKLKPGIKVAITSTFHKSYPKIHLLMSMFYMAKMFKVTTIFPKRICYLERDMRQYCYNICYKLQLVNTEYNVNNGLVKPNGYLKAKAYQSISSQVMFERSVVRVDECPYCGKRSFVNLASHIRMKHANDAVFIRRQRK